MSPKVKGYLKQFCIVAVAGNLLYLFIFPFIRNIDFDRMFRDYWFIVIPIFRSVCIFLLLLPLLPVFIYYDKRFEGDRPKLFIIKITTAILYATLLLLGWIAFIVQQANNYYQYFDFPKTTMAEYIQNAWFPEMLPVLCVIFVLMFVDAIQNRKTRRKNAVDSSALSLLL
jgi:hypothetical protein